MKKETKLSAAEEARLREFEELSERMAAQGYHRVILTINILTANLFSLALMAGYGILAFWLFLRADTARSFRFGITGSILLLICFLVGIVVHELIHGLTWACFSEHHWKDISFGVKWDSLTPYCTCKAPLGKGQYIIGALMPMLLLGVLPTLIAIFSGSFLLLILGVVMFASAAGDIMIVWKFLTYRIKGSEAVYIDHPTEAGSVIFER